MNVEIGTETAQFPDKEYRNGILVAVWGWPFKSPKVLTLTCGKKHAGAVGPAPAQPVNGELSHKDGGQLSQGQQGKVPEHAPSQVHSIQLRTGINKKEKRKNLVRPALYIW